MPLVRVQAKGQMTIPRGLREACGIDTGAELWCIQTGPGVFECRVQPAQVGLREYLDSHTLPGPGPSDEEIERDIEEGMAGVVQVASPTLEPV